MENGELVSSDLYESAGIAALSGTDPDLRPSSYDLILFVFPATPKVVAARERYQDGAEFPLVTYSHKLKRLRGLMLTMRHQGAGR